MHLNGGPAGLLRREKGLAPSGGAPRILHVRAKLQALKELPQPQVDLTFGLLNLKPAPSRVST